MRHEKGRPLAVACLIAGCLVGLISLTDGILSKSQDSGLRLVDPSQRRFPVPPSFDQSTQRGECDVQSVDSESRDEGVNDDAWLEARTGLDDIASDTIPNC